MRRMVCWAPRPPGGSAEALRDRAAGAGAADVLTFEGEADGRAVDVLVAHVDNARVGELVAALQDEAPQVRVSLLPQGALLLRPPTDEVEEQVKDVTRRSPLEVWLGGLQSVGSWWGFLSYAAMGGAVAWTGLITNTTYLLVAAMLIAPYAGPAMTAALASARGDRSLLGRSVGRYAAGLATSAAVTAALTAAFGVTAGTRLMTDIANISLVAVVLPIAAGIAGAVNLSQSERSSLVPGAATGMLVAASLAPPAAVVGMAAVLRLWGMAQSAAFLLLLQLAGINLAAAVTFWILGLGPEGPRYPHGRAAWRAVSVAASAVALVALVAVQVATPTALQRRSITQEAEEIAVATLQGDAIGLVDVEARIPRGRGLPADRLLVIAHVEHGAQGPDAEGAAVADRIGDALRTRFPDLVPLVSVTVLAP